MKALAKFAIVLVVAGMFAVFVVEWAAQLAETEYETVRRHQAMLGDE